jgi:hypothetical protein
MIDEYLQLKEKKLNYYDFQKWSGLPFPKASSEWNRNIKKIKQLKNEKNRQGGKRQS